MSEVKFKKILLSVTVAVLFGIFVLASFSGPFVNEIDHVQEYNQVTFNAPFTIHFSQLMNKKSVEDAFAITPKLTGAFKWKDGRTLEYRPSKILKVGDKYRLTIKSSAKSLWMKQIGADTNLKFVVTGPPFVIFRDPAENELLRTGEVITVMFDRPMAFKEIPDSELVQTEPKIDGAVRYVGMSAIQFIPDKLKSDQEYKITIPGGLPALDGGKTKEAVIFTVQTPALNVSEAVPADGMKVEINQALEIKFDRKIDLNQIRPGKNALLFPSNDLDADINQKRDGFFNTEVRYGTDEDGNRLENVLIFTPGFPYQYDQDYKFMLKADDALSLEKDFELTFKTIPDPSASVPDESKDNENRIVSAGLAWESEGMDLFIRGENPRLRLLNQPTETISIDACQLSSNDYIRIRSGRGFASYNCETEFVAADTNETVINLNDYFKLKWATGVYFASINMGEEKIWKTFLVEDTSILLKKSKSEVLVWASDIKSGDPIPEMEIEILSFDGSSIAKGLTDEMGIYNLNKALDEGVYVRAKKKEDGKTRWALVFDQWILNSRPERNQVSEIYLLSNQNRFSPGETIELKGIWRQINKYKLGLPNAKQVVVKVEDYYGNRIVDRRVPLKRNGSFDTAIDLPYDSFEGNYRIVLTDINNQTIHEPVPIQLQSEIPPVKLEWNIARNNLTADQAPVYILSARNANGIPSANVRGKYTLYQKFSNPELQKGATSYSFSSLSTSCRQNCPKRRFIKEDTFSFDSDGMTTLVLTDEKDEFLDPGYEYEIVAEVLLDNGPSGFARQSFTVHQGEFDLGLGVKHAIVEKNNTLEADVIALTHNRDVLEDQKVNISLINSKGKRVFKKSVVTDRTQTTISIPLGQELQEGIYILRAESTDKSNNTIVSEKEVYLISEKSPALNTRLMLASDQEKYFLGGRAHLIISEEGASEDSPVPVLLSYERDGLLGFERIDLTAPITKIAIPIEKNMLPNFLVKVTRFNRGLLPSYETDSVLIDVEDDASIINLDFTLEPARPEPGEELTVIIKSYDYQNRPVSAVLTIGALQGIFTDEPISNRSFFTQDPREITDSSTIGVIGKKGISPGEFNPLMRKEDDKPFIPNPPSVYFNPILQTDESGLAEISFTLPKERLDIQLIATATKNERQFGYNSQIIRMNQVLSIKPILPGFVSPGDQTVFAALVTNVSDEIVNSSIELETDQVAIRGDSGRNITLKPGQQIEVSFNVIVNQDADSDTISIKFATDKDVSVTELPIKYLMSSLDLVENGLITNLWSGRILPPSDAFPGSGQIQFTMSGSPLTLAHVYADALEKSSIDSTYYPASRLIAKAVLDDGNDDAKKAVGFLTGLLLKRANSDGSYSFRNTEEPDPILTAYVAYAYSKAKNKGVNVDSTKLNQTFNYLWNQLTTELPPDDQLFILWVLGEHEQYDTKQTLTLFKGREEISLRGLAYLLMNLKQLKDAGQTSTIPFLERLKSEIAGQTTQRDNLTSFDDNKLLTAIMLYAFASLDATNPILDNMANYLISEKIDLVTRFNPEEAIWTILALSELNKRDVTDEINYITRVKLNGSLIMDQSVTTGSKAEIFQAGKPASILSTGQINDLFIKKDGIGPLYFDAHLISYLNPELVLPVEDGVIITRSYFARSDDGTLSPADTLKKGMDYISRLELIVPKDMDYVTITDPVSAGTTVLETIELSSVFDEFRVTEDGISFFANNIPAGVYKIDSLIQPNLPGVYQQLPAEFRTMFDTKTFSRTNGGVLRVTE